MNAALSIFVILASFGIALTLAILYSRRIVRLIGHSIIMGRLRRETSDAQAEYANNLEGQIIEMRDLVAQQQAGLQAQADLLVREGIRRPDQVYQIPAMDTNSDSS